MGSGHVQLLREHDTHKLAPQPWQVHSLFNVLPPPSPSSLTWSMQQTGREQPMALLW